MSKSLAQPELPEDPSSWTEDMMFLSACRMAEVSASTIACLSSLTSTGDGDDLMKSDSFICIVYGDDALKEITENESAKWFLIERLFEGKIYFLPAS